VSRAIPILNWVNFFLNDGVMVLLLVLAVRYKLSRTLKSLVTYAVFACLQTVWMSCIGPVPKTYKDPGFYFYFYSYWVSAFILAYLRLYVILEICKLVLRDYSAVKMFAWRILSAVAVIMFSWTAYFAIRNAHHPGRLVLTFQQTTDLSFAVLLLTLMSLGVYYNMNIHIFYRRILVGSCIYSAEQVVSSELLRVSSHVTNSVFDFAARFSWLLMMAFWSWAVWRWAGAPIGQPELIPQAMYDNLSPRVHSRLRELNNRLAALGQS
jgi:hypothetical protein